MPPLICFFCRASASARTTTTTSTDAGGGGGEENGEKQEEQEEDEPEGEVKLCQHCQNVAVCSSNDGYHGRIHRPEGLGQCLPIRVEQSPEVGRYLVATRDINPGEIVILDKAVLVAPDAPVCLGCLKSVRIQETTFCSRCQFPVCNADCEKRPIHAENECKVFSEAQLTLLNIPTAPQFIYHCIGILRTLLAGRRSKRDRKVINELMAHTEERYD